MDTKLFAVMLLCMLRLLFPVKAALSHEFCAPAVGVVNRMYCRLKGIPESGNMPTVEVISTPG